MKTLRPLADYLKPLPDGDPLSDNPAQPPKEKPGREAVRLLLPSYTIMDLAFYYDHPAFYGTFKMSNVFDETYYESGEALEHVVPGAP